MDCDGPVTILETIFFSFGSRGWVHISFSRHLLSLHLGRPAKPTPPSPLSPPTNAGIPAGDFHCDGWRLGELKNRVSLASIVHLGLGIWGNFCGELLLRVRRAQRGGRGRRWMRVWRRRGPAALFGVGAQLGFVPGQQVADAQQIILATTAGVGPAAFLGFRRGQQVGC